MVRRNLVDGLCWQKFWIGGAFKEGIYLIKHQIEFTNPFEQCAHTKMCTLNHTVQEIAAFQ